MESTDRESGRGWPLAVSDRNVTKIYKYLHNESHLHLLIALSIITLIDKVVKS